jgi:hypothetical protein
MSLVQFRLLAPINEGNIMNEQIVANAFNEWMRRYTEEPDQFAREWQTVGEFLRQEAAGDEPDYGKSCAAYLSKLMAEVS